MSVDLEDYFCDLPMNEWSSYESKIEETTMTILELFSEFNVKSTFFTLGYFAKKFPNLIKKIHDDGHELATHTFSHMDLRTVSKEEFETDLIKSIQSIENVTGEKIYGFRAPFFSINEKNIWVIEILKKHLSYDSSIFPVKTPLYGIPSAPRTIYHPSSNNILENDEDESFFEIPPATLRILNYNLPTAGGFYLRFFPSFLLNSGIRTFNKKNMPAMFFIHPKDLDPHMPKVKGYSWHYYYGKHNIIQKFSKILQNFKFTTARSILKL